MFHWYLDGHAQQEFDGLPPQVKQTLAAFMDAVVLVDPLEYQRRRDEPSGSIRMLSFGTHDEGLVTLLVYEPGDLVLVVRIQWLGD